MNPSAKPLQSLPKNSHRTRALIETGLWVLALGICAYFALSFLLAVFANYWPGPFVDYWIDIPNVEKFFKGELTFHNLISAHANVHRLLIPRLLFIADYRFFSGSNVLLIWVSILCKIATLLLFNHIIKDQAFRIKVLLNALLFAAIFNAANLSNVLHNSNMQWDLVSVFSCFSLYFYSQHLTSAPAKRVIAITTALLFFIGGFLSQAGALPVLLVFIFISLLNKKWGESAFSLIFMALVFYLTFFVLPVNEPEKPTYESALIIFILKLKYVGLYVFKMFSGSIYPLDRKLFIFSWIILALFILSLAFSSKTKAAYNNTFLSIALFAFLMMVTIAAARVDFAPNTWAANRYQTNVMLFILSLSLHSYFSIPIWFGDKYKNFLRIILFTFSLGSFFIPQYYLNNYAAVFGNKVLNTQAYMLTHGVNQYNGADLLLSLQEYDRIAMPDPLFRQRGFAWYANKQGGNGLYKEAKKTGETLLVDQDKPTFAHTCSNNAQAIQYRKIEGYEGLQFSTPLDTAHHSFISAVISRNTYYVLDENGMVTGFSYLAIDPAHPYSKADIKGYTNAEMAKYIVEIDNAGHTVCLYSLDQKNNPEAH